MSTGTNTNTNCACPHPSSAQGFFGSIAAKKAPNDQGHDPNEWRKPSDVRVNGGCMHHDACTGSPFSAVESAPLH